MILQVNEDWQLRCLSDGSFILYHPFVGNLLAIDEVAASLVVQVSSQPSSADSLQDALRAAFPEEDPDELHHACQIHLSSLIEHGVLAPLADSTERPV